MLRLVIKSTDKELSVEFDNSDYPELKAEGDEKLSVRFKCGGAKKAVE